MHYGGFWRRLGAHILDGIVSYLLVAAACGLGLGIAYLTYKAHGGTKFDTTGMIISFFVIGAFFVVTIPLVYHAEMEASRHRATLGKLAVGLKVTDEAQRQISRHASYVRNLTKWLPVLILSGLWTIIELIAFATDDRRRAVHDRAAGTIVIEV